MQIDNHIERSEEGLEQLISVAANFEENHYLDAIRQKKMKEYDILQLTEDVKLWHSRMRKESLKLAAFSEHFLEEFATDNNRRFHDAYNLFSKVRSTISGSQKVFKKFCRRIMKNPSNPDADKSILTRSILASHAVSQDIFGILSYNDKVQVLYEELKTFFTTLVLTMSLCHRMISDEKAIKGNADRCLEIYMKCRQNILSSARMFAKTFNIETKQVSESELIERRKNAKSTKEYAQRDYHTQNKSEFLTVVAYEVVAGGQNQGMTETESKLWPDNLQKVQKVRWAITQLDKLVPANKKNIDGKLIYQFIKWCGVSEKLESKVYQYLKENYHGLKHLVGWTQVFNTRKDYGKEFSNEQLAEGFDSYLVQLEAAA